MCNVHITILLCCIIKDIWIKIQALYFYSKKIHRPIMQISIPIYKPQNVVLHVQRIINYGVKIFFFFNAKIKILCSCILLRVLYLLYGSV